VDARPAPAAFCPVVRTARRNHSTIAHPARSRTTVAGYLDGSTVGYNPIVSKVMVSLPDDLLVQLDAEVKRRSTSRSALLAIAARRELARRDPADLAAAIERSERRFRDAGSFESADLIRSDRDNRR
jgi:hypothetical protein